MRLSQYPRGTRMIFRAEVRDRRSTFGKPSMFMSAVIERPATKLSLAFADGRKFVVLPRSLYVVAARHIAGRWSPCHFMRRYFLSRPLDESLGAGDLLSLRLLRGIESYESFDEAALTSQVCVQKTGSMPRRRESFDLVCHDTMETFSSLAYSLNASKSVYEMEKLASDPDGKNIVFDCLRPSLKVGSLGQAVDFQYSWFEGCSLPGRLIIDDRHLVAVQ